MSRRPQGRHLHLASAAIEYAVGELGRAHPSWVKIAPAGDFRRGCELISDLALVAVDPKHRGGIKAIKHGELTVYLSSPERYGIALLFATGSTQHLDALIKLAKKKGMTLDVDGLRKKTRFLAQATEEEVYATLDVPFIPPELRETGEEVRLAQRGKLPTLITRDDLHGVLHAHTTESDGSDTLKDMAEATRQRHYQYLGITDHSRTAHYAGGLKADEVAAKQKEIDRLNKRGPKSFRVFKGIECDILGDGALDYPDDVLGSFDLIVASVHSKFRMSKKEQTHRIVRAIENPHTAVLGHVTGRQLLKRPGYEVDLERILKACAKYGVAIEINAHPWRLDLDWRWCQRGLELGCLFSINPDAHSTDEIDNIQWGILMARKGGVPKERVLNALTLPEFAAHLEARRARRVATYKLRKPARSGSLQRR